MSSEASTPPSEIRIMMATTYLALSIMGLLPNILLAIVLIKNRSKLLRTCFFVITTQILICDIGELLTQVIVAFPLSLYGSNVYEGSGTIYIYYITNIVDTISYNGVLLFTFVMAVNRLTVFMYPSLHIVLFSPLYVWRTVVVVWCIIIFEVAGANILHCWKRFSYDEFYFFIKCYSSSWQLSIIWLEVMRYQSYALPIIMFMLYMCLFVFIRFKSSSSNKTTRSSTIQKKTEMNLLIQAVILTVFLELQTLSFTFLPKVGAGYNKYYSSLAQNVISILNNSINPYVYFFINMQIRREMITVVCGRRFATRRHGKTVTKVYDLTNF
ncbi:hypothetical protein Y032_0220g2508 [Ancylostoma ceylanicum]|nr:hypothetical protein Y032_0220g2508 [Ancylostoma ceylanicum]